MAEECKKIPSKYRRMYQHLIPSIKTAKFYEHNIPIYKIKNIKFRFKYILIPKFEILVLKIPAFYELNIIYILYYNVIISTFLY